MSSNKEIKITHNKNTSINGNTILDFSGNNGNIYINNIKTYKKADFSLRDSKKYDEILVDDHKIDGPILRNVFLNNIINKFIHISNINMFTPTLRVCGYFSSLSSIRQKSETDDFALLELEEKESIIKMVKMGFNVRIILILDARIIINKAYSVEQYTERCKDLYNSIKVLEKSYPNLQIVVNSINSVSCGYIFDSLLVVQTDKYDLNAITLSYNTTRIFSSKEIVENEINFFDSSFNELLLQMEFEKGIWKIENTSDLVYEIAQRRCKHYLNSKFE